ncbi:unnamed protein product [Protopolystoma xenopodis]|uniref:Uncharacterized protein n=1 Tax=Protopolystoma xenopodis TaxID=117903 RepID=A0A3S5CHP7_9PLAT|nr:unnamed protein product [Protopolystoma xenopodis]
MCHVGHPCDIESSPRQWAIAESHGWGKWPESWQKPGTLTLLHIPLRVHKRSPVTSHQSPVTVTHHPSPASNPQSLVRDMPNSAWCWLAGQLPPGPMNFTARTAGKLLSQPNSTSSSVRSSCPSAHALCQCTFALATFSSLLPSRRYHRV